mmetsp:Transcript_49859/g.108008  ORF Transcript_49859/g.108008 Transcript_49859/m.108008 type:complete len:127 (+) Transcript_49859:21-401(+)
MDFLGLRRTDACFDRIVSAVLELPQSKPLADAVSAIRQLLPRTYASVHLRSLDAESSGVGSEQKSDSVAQAVQWLEQRLQKRLPAGTCAVFVATNLPCGRRLLGGARIVKRLLTYPLAGAGCFCYS